MTCPCLRLAPTTALTVTHASAREALNGSLQDYASNPCFGAPQKPSPRSTVKSACAVRRSKVPISCLCGVRLVSDIRSTPPALQAQAGDPEAPSIGSKGSAALRQGRAWRCTHAQHGSEARWRKGWLKLWQGQGCQYEEQPQLWPQQGSRLELRGTPKGALRHVGHHLHEQPEV